MNIIKPMALLAAIFTSGMASADLQSQRFPVINNLVKQSEHEVQFETKIHNPTDQDLYCKGIAFVALEGTKERETLGEKFSDFLFLAHETYTYRPLFSVKSETPLSSEENYQFALTCSDDKNVNPSEICDPAEGACLTLCSASKRDKTMCQDAFVPIKYRADSIRIIAPTNMPDKLGVVIPFEENYDADIFCNFKMSVRIIHRNKPDDTSVTLSRVIKKHVKIEEDSQPYVFKTLINKPTFWSDAVVDRKETMLFAACTRYVLGFSEIDQAIDVIDKEENMESSWIEKIN